MAYSLGIDVGTTYTAGAVRRCDASGATNVESLRLGNRSTVAPTVVYVSEDRQWLFGDAAERRAHERPDLVAREFKRRIGDPVPLVVGPACPLPEELVARLVRWVIDRATEQEGSAPSAITVTHPAGWSSYKCRLLRSALEEVGVSGATLVSEPVAAAAHYAALERISTGMTVAVYDLGGGTFDTAVVRKTGAEAFDLLGSPHGLEHVGGADFDQAVLRHVQQAIDLPPIEPTDRDGVSAMLRLRRECTEAKEALSTDTEATVPVLLPAHQSRVRLMRAEFEGLVRADIMETVDVLADTITGAGLEVTDLDAVLLVGGSSRMPLVAELVSERLALPVVVDTDPETAIALGAALLAAAEVRVEAGAAVVAAAVDPAPARATGDDDATHDDATHDDATHDDAADDDAADDDGAVDGGEEPPTSTSPTVVGRRERTPRRRRVALSAASVMVLAGTGVAAIGAFGAGEAPKMVADAVASAVAPRSAEAAPVDPSSGQSSDDTPKGRRSPRGTQGRRGSTTEEAGTSGSGSPDASRSTDATAAEVDTSSEQSSDDTSDESSGGGVRSTRSTGAAVPLVGLAMKQILPEDDSATAASSAATSSRRAKGASATGSSAGQPSGAADPSATGSAATSASSPSTPTTAAPPSRPASTGASPAPSPNAEGTDRPRSNPTTTDPPSSGSPDRPTTNADPDPSPPTATTDAPDPTPGPNTTDAPSDTDPPPDTDPPDTDPPNTDPPDTDPPDTDPPNTDPPPTEPTTPETTETTPEVTVGSLRQADDSTEAPTADGGATDETPPPSSDPG